MKIVLMHMMTIMMIMMIMMMLILVLTKKSVTEFQKMSPFECGFNPISNKRLPFSIHFFMIAIIFMIFDVEIIIILPSILMMKFTMMKYWSITSMVFIFSLTMGLYYEWYNGMLNWTK